MSMQMQKPAPEWEKNDHQRVREALQLSREASQMAAHARETEQGYTEAIRLLESSGDEEDMRHQYALFHH